MNLDTLITDLQAAHAGYAVEAERERLGLELETAFAQYELALNAPHARLCPSIRLDGSLERCHCRRALNIERALKPYRAAAYQAEQAGVRLFSPERLESELAHTA